MATRQGPIIVQSMVTVNPSKITVIFYSYKLTTNISELHIIHSIIKWSSKIKYLGIIIDNKLNFSNHIKLIKTKTNAVHHIIFSLINKKNLLPTRIIIYIYKAYIHSILLYASLTWSLYLSQISWSKLEAAQTKILQTITDQPWFVVNLTF